MTENIERMKELINILNEASKLYYQYNTSMMTDFEYDRLYDELVDKVTEKVGNITNVDMLKVGYDGSLNGIIVGHQGRAKVETIVAEGPIQCRHYRVLVHKLK